jgi:hypothetical protein
MNQKNTRSPRFSVEFIDGRFAIFDAAGRTFTDVPGNTRADADRICVIRNGTGVRQRRYPKYGTKRRRLLEILISNTNYGPVWINDGLPRLMRVRGEESPRRPTPIVGAQRRKLVADYKKWLPPLLRTWADVVAEGRGYGGERRSAWSAISILTMLGGPFYFLTGPDESVENLHFQVMPNNEFEPRSPEHYRKCEAICLHYLSTAKAAQKAAYLGMSKATYLRYVDAAHQLVAQGWIP